MSSRIDTPNVQLDHIHSDAVCRAIGEVLRDRLTRQMPDVPQTLRMLIDRLPELDRELAPSIVPAMGSFSETH